VSVGVKVRTPIPIAAIVLAVSAVVCGYLGIANHHPRFSLEIDKQVEELHVVHTGTVHVADFEINNRGKVPVEVMEIVRSCSCTEIEIDSTLIEPACTARLSVTYRVGGNPGPFETSVRLLCREPGSSEIHSYVFAVRANVVPQL